MADIKGFDSTQHDDPGFDPLPEGNYLMIVESSELKPTKAGTGSGINLKLQVIDGENKGRTMFWWLNYNNPNETAQRIGRSELAALCRAVNILQPKDTMELHNIPFVAHVVVTPAKDGYDPGNKVKKVESKAEFAKASQAAGVAPANSGAPGSKAPWAK